MQTFTAPHVSSYPTNGSFYVGKWSTSATYSRYYSMDDFRMYSRALTQAQIQAAMKAENPTTSTFGPGCGTPVPTISANGMPNTGNAGFRLSLSGAANSKLMALSLGTQAHLGGAAPVAIGALGTGCQLEHTFDLLLAIGVTSTTGTNTFPLPIPPGDPGLIGFHAYATYYVGPLGTGQATSTLDINIQQ